MSCKDYRVSLTTISSVFASPKSFDFLNEVTGYDVTCLFEMITNRSKRTDDNSSTASVDMLSSSRDEVYLSPKTGRCTTSSLFDHPRTKPLEVS